MLMDIRTAIATGTSGAVRWFKTRISRFVVSVTTSERSQPLAWCIWPNVQPRGTPCASSFSFSHSTNVCPENRPPHSTNAEELTKVRAEREQLVDQNSVDAVFEQTRDSGNVHGVQDGLELRLLLHLRRRIRRRTGTSMKDANRGFPSRCSLTAASISAGVYPAASSVAVIAPADVPTRRAG